MYVMLQYGMLLLLLADGRQEGLQMRLCLRSISLYIYIYIYIYGNRGTSVTAPFVLTPSGICRKSICRWMRLCLRSLSMLRAIRKGVRKLSSSREASRSRGVWIADRSSLQTSRAPNHTVGVQFQHTTHFSINTLMMMGASWQLPVQLPRQCCNMQEGIGSVGFGSVRFGSEI